MVTQCTIWSLDTFYDNYEDFAHKAQLLNFCLLFSWTESKSSILHRQTMSMLLIIFGLKMKLSLTSKSWNFVEMSFWALGSVAGLCLFKYWALVSSVRLRPEDLAGSNRSPDATRHVALRPLAPLANLAVDHWKQKL
jgi:hypothetical protein